MQRVQDLARQQNGVGAFGIGHLCRYGRGAQDAVAVDILARIEGRNLTGRAAGGDDGDLAAEIHETFQDRGRARHGGQRGVGILRPVQPRLSLAVIAQPPGLQDRRAADFGKRLGQILGVIHGGEGGGLQAEVAQEGLLDQPVLADGQRAAVGVDRAMRLKRVEGRGGDVLELIGHDIDRPGKGRQRIEVLIGRGRHAVGNMARRGIGGGFVDMGPVAKARGGDGQHPAKLAAAEDTDGGACGKGAVGHAWSSRFSIASSARVSAAWAPPSRRVSVICRLSVPSVASASRSWASRPARPFSIAARKPAISCVV